MDNFQESPTGSISAETKRVILRLYTMEKTYEKPARARREENLERLMDAIKAARALRGEGLSVESARMRLGCVRQTAPTLRALEDAEKVVSGLQALKPSTRKTRLSAIRSVYSGLGLELPQAYREALRTASRLEAQERNARLGTWYMRRKAKAAAEDPSRQTGAAGVL